MRAANTPLLVFGIDAGDPALLEQWIADGSMPHLAALVRDGSRTRTGGDELSMEHGARIALMSGVPRAQHGYHYYRQLVPGTYRRALTTGPDPVVAPFWSAGTDRRVVIIDVPDFDPIDGLDGVQIADLAVHNREREGASLPLQALADALKTIGDGRDIPEAFRSPDSVDRQILSRLLVRVERKGQVVRRLVADTAPDVSVVVFGEGHTAGHQFWRHHHHADGDPELREGIRAVYQAIDAELGALRALMPAPHNVAVVSSVGLRSLYPGGGLGEAMLRALDYQCAPRPVASAGIPGPLAIARKLLPTSAREWLSRRLLSRDARERLLADGFANGTDWTRTRAFSIPSAFQSFVRVNLRGREPQGSVTSGVEYEALLDELEADLRALRDAEFGRTLAAKVTRLTGRGGMPPTVLPDLIVDWDFSDRFITTIDHPRARITLTEPEFFRDSEHTAEGFLALAGPHVPKLDAAAPFDAGAVAALLGRLALEPIGSTG